MEKTASTINRFRQAVYDKNVFDIVFGKNAFLMLWARKFSIRKYHDMVVSGIRSVFPDIVEKYAEHTESHTGLNSGKIWICWWQGMDQMPEIVRQCFDSVKEHTDHEIVLITENNFMEYADIPAEILQKLKDGIITVTNFSDMLRFAVLKKNGGLWMDATLLAVGDIPEDIFRYQIFTRKKSSSSLTQYVSHERWAGFFLGGCSDNVLFDFAYDIFAEYWSRYNVLFDYFMIDYVIAAAYTYIPEVKSMLDAVPENNSHIHEYEKYGAAVEDTYVYKLSWRK